MDRRRPCSCHKCNKFNKNAAYSSAESAAAAGDAAVPSHDWREAMDASTMQLYYNNTKTMETTWTRPDVMGPAPSATGW